MIIQLLEGGHDWLHRLKLSYTNNHDLTRRDARNNYDNNKTLIPLSLPINQYIIMIAVSTTTPRPVSTLLSFCEGRI